MLRNLNVDCEKNELDRNARNAQRRSLLQYKTTWLPFNTFTNQSFHFFTFSIDCMNLIFWKYILKLMKQRYWYVIWTSIPQTVLPK